MSPEDEAAVNRAAAAAMREYQDAAVRLKDATATLKGYKGIVRRATQYLESWRVVDGVWVCGESVGNDWPTPDRVVATFDEIDKAEADLEKARADLRHCGIDPSTWR